MLDGTDCPGAFPEAVRVFVVVAAEERGPISGMTDGRQQRSSLPEPDTESASIGEAVCWGLGGSTQDLLNELWSIFPFQILTEQTDQPRTENLDLATEVFDLPLNGSGNTPCAGSSAHTTRSIAYPSRTFPQVHYGWALGGAGEHTRPAIPNLGYGESLLDSPLHISGPDRLRH